MKYFIHCCLKYIYFRLYYLRHKTNVKSLFVSVRAKLGKRVLIENGVSVDSNSSIGNYSYVNQNVRIENAKIGTFSSIAAGVIIGPREHETHMISTHPFWREPFYGFVDNDNIFKYNKNFVDKQNATIIGDDVWIGTNVIVLAGTTIGNGSIIGAASVVTKDVPEYEIWAGVPARKIRDRFPDEIKKILLRSRWTRQSTEWITKNILPNIIDPRSLAEKS